ncbi:MAG: hypothetical protein IKM34_05255 [Clostridia bacterium]|nr:hypothetical protein [Clostridia bacterium]
MENYMSVDKNMIDQSMIGNTEVVWYDIKKAPFALHGFYDPLNTPYYRRVPADVAEAASEGVDKLARESAGGRVRFATDSPYIAIRAKFLAVGRSPRMTLTGTAGFDLYVDGEYGSRFLKEFRMPYEMEDYYEQLLKTHGNTMRTFTVNFPLHSVVETLEIGLKPGAALGAPRPYRDIEPIVYYGSSIVHGTAASRPGFSYSSIISREMNLDFVNLSFSGQAKAEPVLCEWMATLPMSVFVCDYDHNAPDVEHLEKTHYPLYEAIRAKHPDVPYIMITRPDYWTQYADQEKILKRRDVIMESYLKARATGDKNVYFIDGLSFNVMPHQYEMTVDSIHPNDTGFVRMADTIGTVIRHILEKRG